jgi:uncharacterized protein (TIGR03000 family)
MLRLHISAWIAALAMIAFVTPESYAQKGKGGGGGGARGGGARVNPGKVGGSPGNAIGGQRSIGSPGAINSAKGISNASRSGIVNPGAINQGNGVGNVSRFGIANPGAVQGKGIGNAGNPLGKGGSPGTLGTRPSAGLNSQFAQKGGNSLPRNNNLQHNNFNNAYNSRFNNYQHDHGHDHGHDHNHGFNSWWPWLAAFGLWPGVGWWGGYPGYYDALPYYGGYGGYGAYAGYGGAPYSDVMPPYNPTVSPPPIQANANTAQMDVFVPDENAQVWFDGNLTSSKGSTRYFDSPPLQAGSKYQYVLRAAWTQNGQPMTAETVVSVTAGSQVVVDFTQSPPKVTTVR